MTIKTGERYPIGKGCLAKVEHLERDRKTQAVMVMYRVITPFRAKSGPLFSPLPKFCSFIEEAEKENDFEVLQEVEYRQFPLANVEPPTATRTKQWFDAFKRHWTDFKILWNDTGE